MLGLLKKKLKNIVEKISKNVETKITAVGKEVERKVVKKKIDENEIKGMLNEIDKELIEADVAYDVVKDIERRLVEKLVGKEVKRGKVKEEVMKALKQTLIEILSVDEIKFDKISKKPFVILFLGFNGSGKTTSIAKLAFILKKKGYSSVISASDTFRAGSIEQIEEHAKKIGVELVKHKYGADPAAVAYDAISHAKAKGINFVLIDTAGRSHTNKNLMEEMKKIVRVSKPDLKVLVVDSMTGNDALNQARMFDVVGVDALIFTKLDVNEKGGAILSVISELRKPVLFLGIGQKYDDVKIFSPESFVEMLIE